MEIPDKVLAVLVIVAMAISIGGTMTMLSLVPGEPIRITGMAQSEESGTASATVTAEASIILLLTTVDFGDIAPAASNDTYDLSPWPFVVKNNGSIEVNITMGVTGNNLWDTSWNDANFTYNGSVNNTAVYQTLQAAAANMINTTGGETHLVGNLSETPGEDEIRAHLAITVPPSEPAGAKSCTVRFNASAG